MTTQEIANTYIVLFRQGKMEKIHDCLYSTDIICTEPPHVANIGIPTITEGINSVKMKAKARQKIIQRVYSNTCSDPIIAGTYFSVSLTRDVAFKNGQRKLLEEIAVFGVSEGKIITEHFFFR